MSLLPGRFYLDDFFDDFNEGNKLMNMNCDIYEKEGKYNVVLDVPGFSKEDIKINVEDGYLTVEAERNSESNEEGAKYIKKERTYGSVKRQFYIGDVNADEIKAEFKNGTLKITVPKNEEEKAKKQIEIE